MENPNDEPLSPSNDSNPPPMMIMPPPPSRIIENDGNVAAGIDNPTSVRNLKDILKYTTQMTDPSMSGDAASGTDDLTFPTEKKEFLKNVLSSMTVNVGVEMNNAINILLDTKKHVEEHMYAFEIIEEYVDHIDYANDFQKLGGFQVFIPGLKSEHQSVRCKTAKLIATLVQHNAYCQDKFIENLIYIEILMDLVEKDPEEEVRIKALHAISSVVRHNVLAFWKFIDLGGNTLIVNALKSSCDKLKIKAAFLIYSTCPMGKDIAELYVNNGVVEIICSIIQNMEKSLDDYHHELFLSSLNQLLEMLPSKVKKICASVNNFKASLLSLQDSYPNDSNFKDEKEQIQSLMENLTL